ncbi:hypothetical protein JHN63_21155 [Streptomyces sp. MBT65]|nr:hypothetical protein [Streptomyces sp. MBT65]MBK3576281.1 hypothetical protein [Streptomyces sp. MBT65]
MPSAPFPKVPTPLCEDEPESGHRSLFANQQERADGSRAPFTTSRP